MLRHALTPTSRPTATLARHSRAFLERRARTLGGPAFAARSARALPAVAGVLVVAGALALPASAGALTVSAVAPSAPPPRSESVAGAAGPGCAPQTLDASAQLDGAVTVSPMPGARDATPQTQISFLGVPGSALANVMVVGSRTGAHRGRLEAYSQGDGASFVPRTPFAAGETVTVSGQLKLGATTQPLSFRFSVAHPDSLTPTPSPPHHVAANSTQQFVSRPDLQPPIVTVHADSAAQAPGDELLAPYGVAAQAGPMMLDPRGRLLWFEPLPRPLVATNLRVQQLNGAPVLTWWQGTITVHGFGLGTDVVAGSHYETLAEVRAGNGLQADLHEFQITPAGTALLSAYDPIRCDLAAIGGRSDSAVTDSLMQEIDIRTGLVMFEWTSLDHVPLTASYASAPASSTHWPFDFFHLNSINLDPDGTLLVSSRNTWAADEINAQTGQVIWTLGGKQSSFTEGTGAPTAFQHDARPVGPDTFSVFDNGGSPQVHDQSRGVVLNVNPQTRSVSVASQYLHPGRPLLADSQGDMQALANGDWFVGWGQEPDLSEFSASGSLLFDASLPAGYESYRALSFPWIGTPGHPPALVVRPASTKRVIAYASWNGATQVARWELLGGDSPGALTRVAVVGRTGFETAITLTRKPGEEFVAVRAISAGGAVLAGSAAVALPPIAHAAHRAALVPQRSAAH
jgi:hypothetical protein